jgi:hypothetical protein
MNDLDCPFQELLVFFNNEDRQRRMEESEIHHDRAPMAGVVREFEAHPTFSRFLAEVHADRTKRFRQAVGVLVRIIMAGRGWQKTGRKGSLGVRATASPQTPAHNTGGLAFWFIRAERYVRSDGMPYRSVRERSRELIIGQPETSAAKQTGKAKARNKSDQRAVRRAKP